MKEINNKRNIILFIITLVLTYGIIYFLYNYWSDGGFSRYIGSDSGLHMFYTLCNSGLFLPFELLLLFLSSNFIASDFYNNKYSGFQNYIVTRVGEKNRLKYEIKQVLKCSFLLRFILHIFILLIIHIFFSRISFHEYSDVSYYVEGAAALFSNSKVSLLLYLIYSSIGFSIYSLFIYSLIVVIKNKYVYRVSGIVVFIGLVVCTALFGNELYKYFNDIKFANPIMQAINPMNLLSPGVDSLTTVTTLLETHIYYFYSCFCFIIYSLFFMFLRYKKERKNG